MILDDNLAAAPRELHDADRQLRFINFLVDQVLIYLLGSLLTAPLLFLFITVAPGSIIVYYLPFLLVYVAYYYLFERYAGGRTPGKRLTRTRVVRTDGSPPTAGHLLGRSLARLVPFEIFSIYFSDHRRAWHDDWSGTRTVIDESR